MPVSSDRRAVLIVLDGVGCGELPDAADYGDEGSNTLVNLSRHFDDGLTLPHLGELGLGNIAPIRGVAPRSSGDRGAAPGTAKGAYGKCAEKSAGKDSTSGHWELAGVVTAEPFPTYPGGFPDEVIESFTNAIGRGVLGNQAASGTVIIEEFGPEHLETGKPIVYTSADSVFQIAAHESVYPVEELYDLCRTARGILTGEHAVGRVIARPFIGESGSFRRTAERRDFSVEPPEPTLLDRCQSAGIATIGIGKIGDLFAHRGLDEEIHTASNSEGVDATIETMRRATAPALIMTNLVEFDMMWGHRNDPAGYRGALEEFDARLPEIFAAQRPGDMMVIASDHGVDPTTPSTDHSREYIPLLVWGGRFRGGVDLGTRTTFADVGATIVEYLGCGPLAHGESFLGDVIEQKS